MAPQNGIGTVTIEGAQILFRNFEGREGQFNRKGDRNFSVKLDAEVAEQMLADGWNVKTLKAREEGEEDQPYIQVSVAFDRGRPPHIVLITSRNRTIIGDDLVEMLDTLDMANVDLILNPYEYTVQGKSGIKAYLKTMFVTAQEDELQRKYADLD